MQSIFQRILKIWPIVLLGFIAWFSYNFWLNYSSTKLILSNSIEAKDIKVSSKVTGRISKIFIKEGDKVNQEQKLLELEGDEIHAQLDQAKASLQKAQFDLSDLVMGARPQEINETVAERVKFQALVEEAKSKYQNEEADYKRMEELYKEGGISKQKLDESKTQKDVAKEELNSFEQQLIKAKENEDLIKEGPRKDQVKALLAQVDYYKANVKELEKYVSELTVIAPEFGEISSFDLKVGEVIKANQPLLTITDLSDMYVRVYVPGNKLSKAKINQKVKIKADSFPDELFDGYISYIGAQAEYTPRNIQTPEERTKLVYPVKIQITNQENKLRDGMYVTVKL
ncbi:MAG: efflux RND transporter periplasmic adaptor subunit [Candidatus Melainabacteria bacterium]|nr:efflux RND transporter periplasmic adaptor subunit [Candidatus Melainabacteria bacterium]